MSGFDGELLARQLAQLGRDLDEEVKHLGELEEEAVDAEGLYRERESAHDDELDKCFLEASGSSVEVRKAQARVLTSSWRSEAGEAFLEWQRAKARVRTQQANLAALHRRCEIGRSLLSREKALISLAGVGEV